MLGATTAFATVSAPKGLKAGEITRDTISVSWEKAKSAASYKVAYKKWDDKSWKTKSVGKTSALISGLNYGATYYIKVCSVSGSGTSAYTSTLKAQTDPFPYRVQPKEVKATKKYNSISLTWPKTNYTKSYKVFYKASTASSWKSVATSKPSATINNLKAKTKYNFKFKSINGKQISKYTKVVSFSTTDYPTPSKVEASKIKCADSSQDFIKLTWTAPKNAEKFKVAYKLSSASKWSSKTVSSAEAKIIGLKTKTKYNFKIQSICGTKTSSYTAVKSFSTTDYVTPSYVDKDTVEQVSAGKTSMKLSWKKVPYATNYEIRYRIKESGAEWKIKSSTANEGVQLSGLKAGKTYQIAFKTYNKEKTNGYFTNSVYFSTAEENAKEFTADDFVAAAKKYKDKHYDCVAIDNICKIAPTNSWCNRFVGKCLYDIGCESGNIYNPAWIRFGAQDGKIYYSDQNEILLQSANKIGCDIHFAKNAAYERLVTNNKTLTVNGSYGASLGTKFSPSGLTHCYPAKDSKYKPRKGDIVVFAKSISPTRLSHIGIVVEDCSSMFKGVKTIEGNMGSSYASQSIVKEITRYDKAYEHPSGTCASAYIIAYITPNWSK